MNEHPECTFTETCIFEKNNKCGILSAMPKKNKNGVCPFRKRRMSDIGGQSDLYESGKEKHEKEENVSDIVDG